MIDRSLIYFFLTCLLLSGTGFKVSGQITSDTEFYSDSLNKAIVDSLYVLSDSMFWQEKMLHHSSLIELPGISNSTGTIMHELGKSKLSWKEQDSILAIGTAKDLYYWDPDPYRATWMALLIPGGGQIYNRKYWKLPVVYGGFLGCAYALSWNGQMYSDYSQAYLDIMDNNPETRSYEDFLPPRFDYEANEDWLKDVLKNRKDKYRRYRDMSIFAFAGVYIISIIDAYVDAELSHFDVSRDLSIKVRTNIIDTRTGSFGLNMALNF